MARAVCAAGTALNSRKFPDAHIPELAVRTLLTAMTLVLALAETATTAMAATEPVLVFGGTRGTGLEIVRLLRERDESVTVLVRPSSDTAALEALGATTVTGNALDPGSLRAALAGRRFRAAISTIGTSRGDKDRRPDFEGNRNVIDAAMAAGIERFVFITVIGAGDSAGAEPFYAGYFLKEIIALKSKAEEHLRASGLDYTIIRPGGLTDKGAGTTATLVEDPKAFSYISRADLARLTVRALDDPKTYDKTFAAYDPERLNIWNMWTD